MSSETNEASFEKTTNEAAWGQHLIAFIDAKVAHGERNRDTLHETLACIHWALRQLLRFDLAEDIILHVLRRLDYMEGYLSWQIPVPSVMKRILHEDSMGLRTAFMERVGGMAAAGRLNQPQNFIRFDLSGNFLPVAESVVEPQGFMTAESVALLHTMVGEGKVPHANFVGKMLRENPGCLLPLKDEVLIACGDAPLNMCLAPPHVPDLALRRFVVAWWVNVNFPPDQLGDFPYIEARIPAFIRVLLKKGEARLFLSAIGEMSRFRPVWYEQMVGLAAHLGCAVDNLVYLPQNAGFADMFEAFAAEGNAPGGRPKIVSLNSHLLLPSMQQEARIGETPGKKFLCFNHWPHTHRAALFLNMWRDGMIGDSHISFNHSMHNLPSHFPKVEAATLAPWMEMPVDQVAALMDTVEPKLPLRLDLNDITAAPQMAGAFIWRFDARLHEDAAFYLVTESEMEDASVRRFTEKTVKGLAAMNPFIVFGNYGPLATLRELGFRTFSEAIDESYDLVQDPTERFRAAYAEVRRLNALSMDELLNRRRSLFSVLEHNRQRLLSMNHDLAAFLRKNLDSGDVRAFQA